MLELFTQASAGLPRTRGPAHPKTTSRISEHPGSVGSGAAAGRSMRFRIELHRQASALGKCPASQGEVQRGPTLTVLMMALSASLTYCPTKSDTGRVNRPSWSTGFGISSPCTTHPGGHHSTPKAPTGARGAPNELRKHAGRGTRPTPPHPWAKLRCGSGAPCPCRSSRRPEAQKDPRGCPQHIL